MSKGVVVCSMMGKLGNQMFQYAAARSYAERNDLELRCDPWAGESLFDLPECRPTGEDTLWLRYDENTLEDGFFNIELRGYFQTQKALTYTRSDCKRWFKVREECRIPRSARDGLVAHLRRGDYIGYGYVVVSVDSYRDAMRRWAYDPDPFLFVCEQDDIYGTPIHESPPTGTSSVAARNMDFQKMMNAFVFFRSNSSFAWWAAVLADNAQRVFSPVIDGLDGGKEQHCGFVEGNWPKFANLPFVTDLHLKP